MLRLESCPFCGGFGGVSQNIYETHYCIRCASCGCSTAYFNLQEQAVEAWNRRVTKGLKMERKTLKELEIENMHGSETNKRTLTSDNYVPVGAVCSKCGGQLYINNSIVLTTYPPKFQYYCKDCGNVETSFLHLQ